MSDLKLGFDEFEKDMEKIIRGVDDPQIIEDVLEELARPIIEDAKRRVPVNDGILKNGIVSKYTRKAPNEITIGWTNRAFYGKFLEQGYHHTGPERKFMKKPHIRPAYNAKIDEAKDNAFNLLLLLCDRKF